MSLVRISVWCLVLCAGACAQVVPVPSWSQQNQGLRDPSWTVPCYTGQAVSEARAMVSHRRRTMRRWGYRIESHPTSGILLVSPAGTSPDYGLDSGLIHVMDMDAFDLAGIQLGLTLVGRRSDGRSIVRLLSPMDVSPNTLTDLSVPSPPGELWVRATVVGSWLYVMDLADHSVRRYADQDADGKFETRDTAFQVVMEPGMEPYDPFKLEAWSFRRFAPSTCGLVRLSFGRLRPGICADVVEGSPGAYSLVIQSATSPPAPRLRVASLVHEGARRVLVVGTPGLEFVIRRVDATPPVDVSKGYAIPESGWVTVELTAPLIAGQQINVFSSSTNPPTEDSRNTKVLAGPRPQILQHHFQSVERSTLVKFVGNGFAAQFKVRLKTGNTTYDCPMKFVSPGEIHVRMPALGSSQAQPPFQTGSFGRLWLVDDAGHALSDSVTVFVKYTP